MLSLVLFWWMLGGAIVGASLMASWKTEPHVLSGFYGTAFLIIASTLLAMVFARIGTEALLDRANGVLRCEDACTRTGDVYFKGKLDEDGYGNCVCADLVTP